MPMQNILQLRLKRVNRDEWQNRARFPQINSVRDHRIAACFRFRLRA